MDCTEVVFKIFELLLSTGGLVVASIAAYFAYQAFQSQSEQLRTVREQRDEDREAFKMQKEEFAANQPTLVQMRMKNCPRFQIGALPNYGSEGGEEVLSHLIWTGHSTHARSLNIEVSHTVSKGDIPAIQKGEKPGPFLQNACIILSNVNPDADLEQWQIENLEVLAGPTFVTVLLGKIQDCVVQIGNSSMSNAMPPNTWGILLMGEEEQDISDAKLDVRIHFETKTGWQDFHDYEVWLKCASCRRISPPMLPSYKDTYMEEHPPIQ